MSKFTYEMNNEERQAYIKKKGLEKARTKYINKFKMLEELKHGR